MNDDIGEKRNDQTTTTTESPTTEANRGDSPVASASNLQGSAAAPAKSASNPLRRLLWLDERVAEARRATFAPPQPGWAEYDAARHAREGVVQIGETGQSSWAVLLLERAAASLLVRAHAARSGISISQGPLSEADWETVRQVPAVAEAWNNLSAVQVAGLTESLGVGGEHATANLPLQQRKAFALGLHNFVKVIAEPLEFEANRLGRALFARYTRTGIAAVVVIAVVGLIYNLMGSRLEKPNLALHRPVEVSSQYPGAGEDHSLVVNGDHSNLGFHTNCEGPQFVIVNLGAVKKFDQVVVYNRPEYQERAVPLHLEVSSDHQSYKLLATKKEVFDKWTASGLAAEGRYVRLRNTPPNCFHLAEIEVR